MRDKGILEILAILFVFVIIGSCAAMTSTGGVSESNGNTTPATMFVSDIYSTIEQSLKVADTESITLISAPTWVPRNMDSSYYSPSLEFGYSGLKTKKYTLKIWLLERAHWYCASTQICEKTITIDNTVGNNSSGIIRITEVIDIFNYPTFDWVVRLYDGITQVSWTELYATGTSNRPPQLSSIGDKIAIQNDLLEFTINGTDPDGDELTFQADNLPSGASFDPESRTFSWIPITIGNYSNVRFRVIDDGEGNLYDSVYITIIVKKETSEENAYQYLYEVMDKYHSKFDVYTDLSAAGNHFVMLAWMGEDAEINPGCFEKPHSGATCIENKFNGVGNSWGGCYLMNGVLEGEEIKPKSNWGEYPDAGFNLTGATKLTFWAKGKEGGERVEFFAFGVGRDSDTSAPNAPYPDSSPKKSVGYVTLSKEWQQYTIDLSGVDLSYVLGGFGWVTNAPKNNNRPITFYLDDIKYDKERLDEPRFLVSFELLPTDVPVLKNTAYPYDNALALLSFLANQTEEDLERAKLIGDALVYALEHDRYFTDGRLRNGYQGGDLKLFPGWKPQGKEDTVRMPGWDDTTNHTWYEDRFCVSTHTGNVAWPIIALLSLYEETREDAYLNASIRLCEWIEDKCRNETGAGGYTGGYDGWEKTANNPQGQTKIPWKSTEHNIDVYVAFFRLYKLTGDEIWKERALHAKHFVEAMWDENEEHFWTGTKVDGIAINKDNIPADTNAWGLMAMDETNKYEVGIKWVENNCYVEADGFKGFDFNSDTDGVWFEGTAHMVIAYQILGDETKANLYLDELRKAQKEANNTNGKGIVAASHDGVSTGFDWIYDARLHVGATAWFVFAEAGYNPYWNIKTSEPIPPLIYVFDTGAPDNPYPSIFGVHKGTITPNKTIVNVSLLYTYSCPGTGGHTEYVAFHYPNGTKITEGHWNGYTGDWHNISFPAFTMQANQSYNYTIRTGSYPQIHHLEELHVEGEMGEINCTSFKDANGMNYANRIPAIRLVGEKVQ